MKKTCIGCGGCANVCPTDAIVMRKLNSAEWLADGWAKTEVPEINSENVLYVIIVMIFVLFMHYLVKSYYSSKCCW